MTSKERLTIAMTGGIPDRVPVLPQITVPHAIRVLEGDRYIEGMIRAYEDPMYAIRIIYSVVEKYGADGMRVPIYVLDEEVKISEESGKYIVYYKDSGRRLGTLDMLTGNIVPAVNQYIENTSDIDRIKVPSVDELLSSRAMQLHREACGFNPSAMMMVGCVSGMTMNYLLEKRGNERALMDLIDEPELVEELMDAGTQIAINMAKALLNSGADALYIGDAASSCSLISPSQFERYCLPRYKKFVSELKPMGKPIYLHICGYVRPIVHLMAETGVDCIEPLDPLGEMTVSEFREQVGCGVALMGGVNTVTLAGGSPDDVRREAKACIKGGGVNGAYILAAGDMIPNEATFENVKAMCDTASSYIYKGESVYDK